MTQVVTRHKFMLGIQVSMIEPAKNYAYCDFHVTDHLLFVNHKT